MPNYTVEELSVNGSPYALAMLLRALNSNESYVTYGDIKSELEQQLGIASIFTVQVGEVAGRMMNDILAVDPRAPLINVLICRPNGIPGRGAGSYLARRYNDPALNEWDSVPIARRRELVEQERLKILAYRDWQLIAKKLYKRLPNLASKTEKLKEQDYNPERGGEAESPEHRRLKEWVLKNPSQLGIQTTPDYANCEEKLLSGDEIDVVFRCGDTFYVIEVKSRRSNDVDFRRGVYQCVKYRAVRLAEQLPTRPKVVAMLVTEAQLPRDLIQRAKLLDIEWLEVKIS